MIIREIVIKNFGPHVSTVIHPDESVTAVIGHNGAGKSFLIETIPAVLFGQWPSRGNIQDGITQGFTGDAYISIEFDFDGIRYLAERKIRKTAKTFSQEAMLYSIVNGVTNTVAGSKVTDFEEAIEKLLGDSKVFFASAFSAQNNSGDIVEAKPTERKKILGELLDLNKYQEMSDNFGSQLRDLSVQLESHEITVATLQDSLEDEIDTDILENNKKAIAVKKTALSVLEKERDEVSKKIAALEAERKSATEQQKLKDDTEDSIIDAKQDIADNKRKIETLQKSVENIESLKKYGVLREAVIKENAEISKRNEARQKIVDANNLIANQITKLNNDTVNIETDIRNAKENQIREVARLKRQIELLDTGDFSAEACKKCQFVKVAFEAKDQLVEAEKPLNLSDYENTLKVIIGKIAELEKTKEVCPEKEESKTIPEDKSNILNEALMAGKEIEGIKRFILQLEANVTALSKTLDGIKVPDIKEFQQRAEKLQSEDNNVTDRIDEIKNTLEVLSNELAVSLERMAKNESIKEQIKKLEGSNRENIKKSKILGYLQRAFGRTGIQALLIDSAIPKLQAISDEILDIATSGNMQIVFSTEKQLRSGGSSESLEILCTDEKGTRDIAHFSGGEQKILRSVIRLTLAIFQSQQSKKKLQTLIIDEAFDALDQANAEKLLNVLGNISHYFKKVVFISHSDDLLAEFPNKVMLKKINGRTVVA